jgi:hypothetical protein
MKQSIFYEDFQDFIAALNMHDVRYILVGGYSVILHGYSRTTGDMDIWVDNTKENYNRLLSAFHHFGMPVFDMTFERFSNSVETDVFTFGKPPVSIDILTAVKGLQFEVCYHMSEWFPVTDELQVRALRLSDLLEAKKAAGGQAPY